MEYPSVYSGKAKCSAYTLFRLWDDLESASPPRSVNRKIALVQRENRVNLLAICKINQNNIGELRVDILVSLHERCDCFGLRSSQGQQIEKAAIDTAQQLLNGSRRFSEQPGRLSYDWPGRKKWSRQIPKHVHASSMILVFAGKNGDQRTSVHQNPLHLLFPKPSK
jgi:hypothetical protein